MRAAAEPAHCQARDVVWRLHTSDGMVPRSAQNPCLKFTTETEPLFDSMFLGGFECSCQLLEDGRRLDLVESTQHLRFGRQDYARLQAAGMSAARDGINWVRSEPRAGSFDFSA